MIHDQKKDQILQPVNLKNLLVGNPARDPPHFQRGHAPRSIVFQVRQQAEVQRAEGDGA